jgi:hypothetical protein
MRLFLLPISTRRSLLYCQRLNIQTTSKQTYVEKITNKASTTWAGWEKAEKGWKKKVTEYGNKAFATIAYEEWGLKSIPPLSARKEKDELEGKEVVELEYPENWKHEKPITDIVRQLATERQALHKKYMIISLVGAPLTAPVALLPV